MPMLCELCPICYGDRCPECSHQGDREGYDRTQALEMELARAEIDAAARTIALERAVELADHIGAPALAEACRSALEELEPAEVIAPSFIDRVQAFARARMGARA